MSLNDLVNCCLNGKSCLRPESKRLAEEVVRLRGELHDLRKGSRTAGVLNSWEEEVQMSQS